MYCKNCGAKLADDSNFCSSCGVKVETDGPVSRALAAPAKEHAKKKKSRKLGCFLYVLVFFLILGSCGSLTDSPDDQPETTGPSDPVVTEQIGKTEKEIFISGFCEESGYDPDVAENLYNFLKDDLLCNGIRFYEKNSVGDFNWDISTDKYNLMVTADEEGVYRVICSGFTLYEDGRIILTYEDLMLRDVSENRIYYAVMAQNIVEGYLKSPSTAKFQNPTELKMARIGDLVAVQGYVDAQNSFGAMMRTEFVTQFYVVDVDDCVCTPVYAQIGDTITGEYIDME